LEAVISRGEYVLATLLSLTTAIVYMKAAPIVKASPVENEKS